MNDNDWRLVTGKMGDSAYVKAFWRCVRRRVRENAIIKCRDLAADRYLASVMDQDFMTKCLYVIPESIDYASIAKIYER